MKPIFTTEEMIQAVRQYRLILTTITRAAQAGDWQTVGQLLADFAERELSPDDEPERITIAAVKNWIGITAAVINIIDLREGADCDMDVGAGFASVDEARLDFDVRRAKFGVEKGAFLFDLVIGDEVVASFETNEGGFVDAVGSQPPPVGWQHAPGREVQS